MLPGFGIARRASSARRPAVALAPWAPAAAALCAGAAVALWPCAARAQEPARADEEPPRRAAAIVSALTRVDGARLEDDVRALAACGTRHPLSPVDHPTRGVGAARRMLRERFEEAAGASDGRARLREQRFERRLGRGSDAAGQFVNFVFELPGADPARGVWVIGGHYDSRNRDPRDGTRDAPGADDDASGTAVVLELARVLATEELAASVWLCAFDGEEHGLLGSDALAEEMGQAGFSVEGMVTNDIVGGAPPRRMESAERSGAGGERAAAAAGDPGGYERPWLRCFSEPFAPGAEEEPFFRIVGGESDGPSRQLARYADAVADRYLDDFDVRLVLRRDRFGRGGDHESFTKRGHPGIRFTEPVEDYRRQHEDVRDVDGVPYGDRVEFVDFEQLARVARLNLALVMNGAGAPPPPARVHLDGAVKPHVTVEWSPVEGEIVAGYRVFARATTDAVWTASRFVPAPATRFEDRGRTIDDWNFGVATVDRDGRESPVRFPTARPRPPRPGAPNR